MESLFIHKNRGEPKIDPRLVRIPRAGGPGIGENDPDGGAPIQPVIPVRREPNEKIFRKKRTLDLNIGSPA
jgi:hypothetical protein